MIKKKIISIFVLILLLIQPVLSQNGYQDYGNYDYGSDDSYNDADFYSNSDPNQWDYDKVDWDKVDFSRQDLYGSGDFYDNMPDDKYNELDYTQVDYSKVTDHNKIDSTKYFQDMGCTSCSLFRGGQDLQFSKNGINHPNGNSVTVPGNYPKGSVYVGKDDRIEVIVPEETDTIAAIPATDDVTVNTQGRDITINGVEVNGEISYENKQAIVKAWDTATINDVRILSGSNDVNVYFDGQNHGEESENFVSFGQKNFIASGEDINIEFKRGKSYLLIADDSFKGLSADSPLSQEEYFLGILESQNDYISFELEKGSLEIEERSSTNNIPFIRTDGNLKIDNNENEVVIRGNKLSYTADKKRYLQEDDIGAVFFELEVGGDETKHYFFDDNHNIMTQDKSSYGEMAKVRNEIKQEHNVDLVGYFSPRELSIFEDNIQVLSTAGIDFKNFEEPLKIYGIDRRARSNEQTIGEAFILGKLENYVFWTPTYNLNDNEEFGRVGLYDGLNINQLYDRVLYHEIGHLLNNQNSKTNYIATVGGQIPDTFGKWDTAWLEGSLDGGWDSNTFEGRWKTNLESFGIQVDESTGKVSSGQTPPSKFTLNKEGDSGIMVNTLFSDLYQNPKLEEGEIYASTHFGESQAEIFATIFTDPGWFENTERVEGQLPEGKTAEDIINMRKELRDLYLGLIH